MEPAYKLENQQAGTTALAVSADSRLFASGGWSGRISIRYLEDARPRGSFQAHSQDVIGLQFLADGRLLSVGREGSLKIWSSSGELLSDFTFATPLSSMSYSGSSNRVALASEAGEIILFDLDQGEIASRWQAHDSRIRALAFSHDSARLASSDSDRTVKLWDANTNQLLWQRDTPSDSRDLVFSSDDRWLFGGGWFDLFKWRVASGDLQVIDTEHHGIINGLVYLAGSETLATVSRQTDSSVLIVDPDSGRTLQRFGYHGLCGGKITVSPDERYLVSNSDDYSVSVWNLVE